MERNPLTATPRAALDKILPRASAGFWTVGVFALIVALAAVLRLDGLGEGHPGLAIYTSISANMARSPSAWLYPSMLADGAILADKPPVFFWLQGAFFALFGMSGAVARLPTALAGIASVVLLFLIIRRCHGGRAALVSAAALAVMPLDVNYSRSTFIEPVAVFLMLGAAYFAVRAVQERRDGFFYASAAVLGVAFLTKLWQGLLPAPAICAMALACRWTDWARFVRIAAASAAVFLAAALWWPLLVWLAPAYGAVMHADNVWDMIFGWNLTQRFGALEYGANHRRDILWFLTGPMSLFLGVSLLPSAAIGAVSVSADMLARARTAIGRALDRLRARFPKIPDAAVSWIAPRRSPFAADGEGGDALVYRPSVGVGLLWTVWALAAIIAFGGTSVRLATYWTAAAPAFAALSGIGIVSLAPRLRRRDGLAWALAGIAFGGIVYCAGVYGSVGHLAPHFRQAALVCWALSAVVLVAAALMYFELRALRGRLPAWTITAACALAALASGTVVFHNLTQPRDDTLGRIGFDMVDFPAPPQPPPETLGERRVQLQGALITAIVRTELDDLLSALDYARRHGGDERRYLLAADTYNTAAMVTFLTGEPVLPLYSEYSMTPLLDDGELRRVLEDGETRFILTAAHMQTMDWRLYGRIRSSATDVTSSAGLPHQGEMRLFRVRERR